MRVILYNVRFLVIKLLRERLRDCFILDECEHTGMSVTKWIGSWTRKKQQILLRQLAKYKWGLWIG